jgi:cysteine desulfurase
MTRIQQLFSRLQPKKRIYLDYGAATPVHDSVVRAMQPFLSTQFANPGSIHAEGVLARRAIDNAREEVARTLRVRTTDITFTSGGTESNNLAILGYVHALHARGKTYESMEIISTRIEHPSILEVLQVCAQLGVRIIYTPLTEDGTIVQDSFVSLLNPDVVLVTFAYVNSEIGTVQDVKRISRAVRIWNTEHSGNIAIHLDASQAPLWLPCTVDMLGVHLMTLDAGKCYGPKGVGVLVHRHGVPLAPILYGGGQEGGVRAGTENVPLIVGCAYALVRAQKEYLDRSKRIAALKDYALATIECSIPGAVINGSRTNRVANNINFSLSGLDTEYATIFLDQKGIAVATRSACGSLETTGSMVVRILTGDHVRALSTLRITLGEDSTAQEIDTCIRELCIFQQSMASYPLKVGNLT